MRKVWIFLLISGFGGALWAAPPAEKPAPDPQPPRGVHGKRNSGFNRYYWRAFSRMTPEERKAMMELQVKDPAEFHRKMRAAVEATRAAAEARRKQINALAERCRTGSEEEKKAAREELTRIFREGYERRLADSRNHLQEMEKRMKKLAEVLKQKEANADQEIRIMVENCIKGIKPQPRRRPGPSQQ